MTMAALIGHGSEFAIGFSVDKNGLIDNRDGVHLVDIDFVTPGGNIPTVLQKKTIICTATLNNIHDNSPAFLFLFMLITADHAK